MNLERVMEWCAEHEKLMMLGLGIATLLLGPVLYCLAMQYGDFMMAILLPVERVLKSLCGC